MVLARRHADCAVQANILTIEITVAAHLNGQRGIFGGVAQSSGVGHLRAQRLFYVVRRALQKRRVENTWQDCVNADQLARKVPREPRPHSTSKN